MQCHRLLVKLMLAVCLINFELPCVRVRIRVSHLFTLQQEYPKLNGDYFQEFLDWLSQQLGGDYAILQIDQAPAHVSGAINWTENIIPLLQPPHSPELNPIERMTAVSQKISQK